MLWGQRIDPVVTILSYSGRGFGPLDENNSQIGATRDVKREVFFYSNNLYFQCVLYFINNIINI